MPDSAYYHRTIVKKQIVSSSLGAERKLWIYLPPGYNELLTYPLLLCQDGKEFLNYGRIATHANYLTLEENMEPLLIAGIEVDFERRSDEYAPDGSRFSPYCRFVANEVMPLLEKEFPLRAGAESRVLAGDSLGGTVSLHLALDYPHLFRRVLSLSGAFMQPTLDRLASETELAGLEAFLLVGRQETAVATQWGELDILDLNRRTNRLLLDKGAQTVYEEKDGKHLWGFWQKELPAALSHFFAE